MYCHSMRHKSRSSAALAVCDRPPLSGMVKVRSGGPDRFRMIEYAHTGKPSRLSELKCS
jgi:hypothetical protein